MRNIFESSHAKTGLKILNFVVAIPKEDLAGLVPAKPSVGVTQARISRPVLA